MTELTHEQKIERGRRAKELKENPLLMECFERLKAEYMDTWRKTDAKDVEGRERIFLALEVADTFQKHLNILIADGTLANQQLEKIKGRAR